MGQILAGAILPGSKGAGESPNTGLGPCICTSVPRAHAPHSCQGPGRFSWRCRAKEVTWDLGCGVPRGFHPKTPLCAGEPRPRGTPMPPAAAPRVGEGEKRGPCVWSLPSQWGAGRWRHHGTAPTRLGGLLAWDPAPLTDVMLDQLLHRLELGPGGDVVAAVVQLPDLIVLHVVAFRLVPVPDGQGVGTCGHSLRVRPGADPQPGHQRAPFLWGSGIACRPSRGWYLWWSRSPG